jgi:predicted tellurium resistance membrane protein TerC
MNAVFFLFALTCAFLATVGIYLLVTAFRKKSRFYGVIGALLLAMAAISIFSSSGSGFWALPLVFVWPLHGSQKPRKK